MAATKSVLRVAILALTFSLACTALPSHAKAEAPTFAAPPPPMAAAEAVVTEPRIPSTPENDPGGSVEPPTNIVTPQFAVEQDHETHQWIAREGYRYFSAQFEGADIASYVGIWNDSQGDFRSTFLEGAAAEDKRVPALSQECPIPLWPDCPYWRHFVAGADGSGDMYNGYLGYPSALTQAEAILPHAVNAYPSNKGLAFYYLGHLAHLVADMNLPTHVHNDGHPDPLGDPDTFEVFMSQRGNFQLWSYGAGRSGNWAQRLTLFTDLYSIFLRTANYTEDYDSEDAPGDGPPYYTPPDFTTEWHHPASVDNSNGIDGTEVLIIADDLVPHAIKRTAELIRLFYFETDTTQPACAMAFPSSTDFGDPDVRTSMTSFSVTANASDLQSGVEKAGYRFSWSYWTGSGWASWVDFPLSEKTVSFTPPYNNTTYAFSVQAWNGAGRTAIAPITYVEVNYSAVSVPTVITNSASSITTTSAVLNATITSDGGASITERRFEYGPTPNFVGWSYTNQVTVSGNTFSYGLSGLTANTPYYFRAWAKNSAGWSYGVVQSFTTAAPPGVVSMPTFSPPPGSYTAPQQITMSTATTGATIRYTTNGAEPTDTSTAYTSPVNISAATNFKAKAFKTGMIASLTASASYTITVTPTAYQITGALTLDGSSFNQPVELQISPDVAGEPFFSSNGQYSVTVPADWSGLVRPVLAGYDFVPSHRDYTSVSEDLSDEDYTVRQPTESPQLTVNIVPQGAVDAGAKWSVKWYLNGQIRGWLVDWFDSGSTIYLTYEGYEYHVMFTDAQGFITPQDIIFTAQANQTYTFQGNYAQLVGSVQVMIEPQAAVTAGAQWRLAGGAWRASGATESGIPIGDHVVQFSAVPGYFSPLDRSVTVNTNQLSTLTQIYEPQSASGPTITSISPNGAPKQGGSTVSIAGTRLLSPLSVVFGESSATSVTWVSDTLVQAVVPPNATVGSVDVTVTTPEGSAVLAAGFTYNALDSQNVELVAQAGGACYAVAVQGNFAYMGEGPNLIVLDCATPASPIRRAKLLLGGLVRGIAVSGTRAYVAAGDAGVYVVNLNDVNNPTPTILGVCDTPGEAWAIKDLGGILYIADNTGGLRIWDAASAPANPQEIGSLSLPGNAYGLDVKANAQGIFAYVATGTGGLRIVDATTPSSPLLRGSYPKPEWFAAESLNVTVQNNVAYLANKITDNGIHGLDIINVANPDSPTYLGQYNSWATDVAVVGTKAYVVEWSGPLSILDISTPSSPQTLGRYFNLPGVAYKVSVASNKAFVALGERGLYILNVATPSAITLLGQSDNAAGAARTGCAVSLAVSSGLLYVGTGNVGLRILNMAAPQSPLVGQYDSGGIMQVAVSSNTAYLLENGLGVRVLNVSNPSSPQVLGSPYEYAYFSAMSLSGSRLYLGGSDKTTYTPILHILNVNNPAAPVARGTVSLDTSSTPWGRTAKQGNYVYVSCGTGGLRIVDVSNEVAPVLRGMYDSPGDGRSVTAFGQEAYLADVATGVQVINVSNPAQPVMAQNYDTPGNAVDVAIGRGLMFIADGSGGLRVFDAYNGGPPSFVGYYNTPGDAHQVAITGDDDFIYVADGYGGVAVLKLRDYLAPTVTITTPTFNSTYTSSAPTMFLGGAAEDNAAVTAVTWSNDRGGSGAADGTDSWFVSNIALQPGVNTITVTAYDAAGNAGNDIITVTYGDVELPLVEIQSPTNLPTHTTSVGSVSLGGIASDNIGVMQVTWSNDRGGNGIATGTQNWSANDIVLQLGPNIITVTARDQAGNGGIDILTVTYAPPDTDGDGVPDPNDSCPNTVPGAGVGPDGCPALVPGDSNRDGDVDQLDLAAFAACASGPALSYSGNCGTWDFDHDNDVDQSDFGIFQRCLSGENNPADPNCAN